MIDSLEEKYHGGEKRQKRRTNKNMKGREERGKGGEVGMG
jgi:hypothetical protein